MTGDTQTIEQSLETDREHLRDTVNAIEEKLSPGRLIDEAMTFLQTGPKEFATGLADQARSNPMPVILTGIGLAWLVTSGRGSHPESGDAAPTPRVQTSGIGEDDHAAWGMHDRVTQSELDSARFAEESHEDWQVRLHAARARALDLQAAAGEDEPSFRTRVTEAAEAARTQGRAARDRIRDQLRSTGDTATRKAHEAKDALNDLATKARTQGRSLGEGAVELHNTNPLVTGALGLALGVVLGTLLPQGEAEEDALGDLADQGLGSLATGAEAVVEMAKDKLPDNVGSPG